MKRCQPSTHHLQHFVGTQATCAHVLQHPQKCKGRWLGWQFVVLFCFIQLTLKLLLLANICTCIHNLHISSVLTLMKNQGSFSIHDTAVHLLDEKWRLFYCLFPIKAFKKWKSGQEGGPWAWESRQEGALAVWEIHSEGEVKNCCHPSGVCVFFLDWCWKSVKENLNN